jgi:hypothetical protein
MDRPNPTILPIELLPDRTVKALSDLAVKVSKVEPEGELETFKLSFTDLGTARASIFRDAVNARLGKACHAIYTIELASGDLAEKVQGSLAGAKATPEKRAFPRLNPLEECKNSACLYVGSSRSTAGRIAQHLGFGARGTYSLHLASWATQLPGDFLITVVRFDKKHATLLPSLEDTLSAERSPILGRRGSR